MPGNILHKVAKARGLRLQDGHPLYAYRPTDEDLEALRQALKQRLARGGTLAWDDAAAFCLYAATWFCREHSGGTWSWSGVLASVGLEEPWPDLYRTLIRGLAHLGRRVVHLRNRRRFLATIAAQGGLPLRLLQNEQAPLAGYVRRVLHGYETHHVPASELAERWQDDLAPSLRDEAVFELIGQLVEAVAALRKGLPGSCADPTGYLDTHEPGWRERLPLRLESDVAKDLLLGLLREPAPVVVRVAIPISIETVLLRPSTGAPRIERHAVVRPHTSPESLQKLLALEEPPPTRFRFALVTANGMRRPLASAAQVGAGFRLEVFPAAGVVREPSAVSGRIELVAYAGPRDLGRVALPGGESLGPLPWVFAERHGHDVLVGVGSTKAPDAALILALPEGGHVVDGVLGPSLGDLALNRTLHGVMARTEVELEGERHVIEPGAQAADALRYEFRGPHVRLGPTGDVIFVGTPALFEADDEGNARSASGVLEWRPAIGGDWQREAPLGDVFLRASVDGRVRVRERVLVFPEGFRVDLSPGPKPGEGTLVLEGLNARSATAVLEGGTTDVRVTPGRIEVKCRVPTDRRPGDVALSILFAGAAQADLRATCPIPFAGFVGASDRPIPENSLLTIDRLIGLRAVVVPLRTNIRHELLARAPGLKEIALGHLAEDRDGARSLPLDSLGDEIEGLLASGDDPDAVVELRIVEEGELRQSPHARVAHYEARFDLTRVPPAASGEPTVDVISLSQAAGVDASTVVVRAQPLWAPGMEQRTDLPRDGADTWRLDHAGRGGPWLITGWANERSRVRPRLVTFPAPVLGLTSTLDRAVLEGNKKRRAVLIDAAVAELAGDAGHANWARANEFLDTLQQLPAVTFDFNRRLVRHPEAAALAALGRSTQLETLGPALERLPFLWSFVSLRAWVAAARRRRAALVAAAQDVPGLDPDAVTEQEVRVVLEKLSPRLPGVDVIAFVFAKALLRDGVVPVAIRDRFRNVSLSVQHPEIAAGPMTAALNQAREQLIREHGASWWPTGSFDELVFEHGLDAWRSELARHAVAPFHPHQAAALAAPLVAAGAVASGVALPPDAIVRLRRRRAFDEAWFDEAFGLHLTQLLPHALARSPELRP